MHTIYGHFEAECFGNKYLFIPSFENMSKIGNKHDIMDVFAALFATNEQEYAQYFPIHNPRMMDKIRRYAGKNQLSAAHLVLSSCYEGKKDISPLIGKFTTSSSYRPIYQMGFENPKVLIALAQHLIKHGMIGESKNKVAQKSSKAITEFNPHEYADMARLHLGMNRTEAWQLTMTEFLNLWLTKFPPDEKQNAGAEMSKEEYAQTMARLESIRDKTLGKKNG